MMDAVEPLCNIYDDAQLRASSTNIERLIFPASTTQRNLSVPLKLTLQGPRF